MKEYIRAIDTNEECSKECDFWTDCHGYRNREHLCPEWTLKSRLKQVGGDTE